ncbi:MAG: hypothetical protein HPY60_05745 [Candidatus Methanofastidiosum sp.]|nr:hypothetical protein [Methanofastidiosum sp.]
MSTSNNTNNKEDISFFKRFIDYLFRDKLEYGILFIGSILIMILPVFFLNLLLNINTNKEILNTIVQILATIFAISISLTILLVQNISKYITPLIIKSYIRRSYIVGLLLTYCISILGITIFSMTDLSNSKFTYYISFLALLWSLVYVVSYLFFMTNNFRITDVVNWVSNKIPTKYTNEIIKNDIFNELEEIILKAVDNNDLKAFEKSIECLYAKYRDIIESIDKIEICDDSDSIDRFQKMNDFDTYFIKIDRLIWAEVKKNNNDHMIMVYLGEINSCFQQILKIKLTEKYTTLIFSFTDNFKDAGFKIIKEGLYLINRYDVFLRKYMINLLKNIDKMPQSEALFRQKEIYDIFIDLLKHYENLSIRSSDDNKMEIIIMAKSNLTELLRSVITNKKGDLRIDLVEKIIDSLRIIHIECLKNNMNLGFFYFYKAPHGPSYLFRGIKVDINDILPIIIKKYCDSLIMSVEKGHEIYIDELKMIAKEHLGNNPEIKIILTDCCVKLMNLSKNKKEIKEVLDSITHYSRRTQDFE